MLVKVYTSIKETYDQMYVGYALFGDKDQEYALNIVKVNERNPISAHTYGVMSALGWVRANKPLYCDISEIEVYNTEVKNENMMRSLQKNEYLNRFGSNISLKELTNEDENRVYRVNQNVEWAIMRDKYNKISQFNKLSGRE